ncbi:unnamed protein product [Protopolystoma xenopodis]|uniref:Uncharacterized protein n=1 Tax=Protopolystoma xenopodis TaxID=117903 RepID=A0A3S5FFS3_9PLAT|nr:unnamed protein product [Protopolystoma xenopodis]
MSFYLGLRADNGIIVIANSGVRFIPTALEAEYSSQVSTVVVGAVITFFSLIMLLDLVTIGRDNHLLKVSLSLQIKRWRLFRLRNKKLRKRRLHANKPIVSNDDCPAEATTTGGPFDSQAILETVTCKMIGPEIGVIHIQDIKQADEAQAELDVKADQTYELDYEKESPLESEKCGADSMQGETIKQQNWCHTDNYALTSDISVNVPLQNRAVMFMTEAEEEQELFN